MFICVSLYILVFFRVSVVIPLQPTLRVRVVMSEESPDLDPEANYKAPAQKSVQEILQADAEDESLRKYKEALLGKDVANVIVDPANPKNVIVTTLSLVVDDRADITIDLVKGLKDVEHSTFVIKEGCKYRLRLGFFVQREIVAGLKYVQKVSRHGIQVHTEKYMVGSYPPKKDPHMYLTPVEEAPSGMMHRGTYKVKSLFTDDDNNEWLKWEWTLEIKKDWQ